MRIFFFTFMFLLVITNKDRNEYMNFVYHKKIITNNDSTKMNSDSLVTTMNKIDSINTQQISNQNKMIKKDKLDSLETLIELYVEKKELKKYEKQKKIIPIK